VETNKLATTVALRGAKRLKLTKIIVSHKTSTTSSGKGTELAFWSYINRSHAVPRLYGV